MHPCLPECGEDKTSAQKSQTTIQDECCKKGKEKIPSVGKKNLLVGESSRE